MPTPCVTINARLVEPINVLRGADGICNVVPDVYLDPEDKFAILQPNQSQTGGNFPDTVIGSGGIARIATLDGSQHITFQLEPNGHLGVKNLAPGFNNIDQINGGKGFQLRAWVFRQGDCQPKE